jgi:hypothetical protein
MGGMNWQSKYKSLDAFIEAKIATRVEAAARDSYNVIETVQKLFPRSWKGVKGKTFRAYVQRARELGYDIPDLNTLYKRKEKIARPQLDNLRFPFTRQDEVEESARFIITSALNDVPLDSDFWKTIERYAKENDAMIIVVPARYLNPTRKGQADQADDYRWPSEVMPYLTDDLVELHEHLHLRADVRIQATASRPLSGIQDLTKGTSAIFGHAQLAMEMVPAPQNSMPKVMWTTGSVSESRYSDTKLGIRGRFHHSLGALVVELNGPKFHARPVLWDGEGFYDVARECRYYTPKKTTAGEAEALLPGDDHADFADEKCVVATYTGDASIARVTKTKKVIRNDVFDGYSISHHHEKNPVTKIAKARGGRDLVREELQRCADYIDRTTPKGAENIVIPSNHHDHLLQWMKRASPLTDPRNADAYIELWAALAPTIKLGAEGTTCGDPLALWLAPRLKSKARFLNQNESCRIAGIEVGYHGHEGINGARGSLAQYARLGVKTVIGHSHTPGITKGAYQTGTMTGRLEYQSGPSTHAQCHVLIYPNGKRQHIFVIDGEWRLEE